MADQGVTFQPVQGGWRIEATGPRGAIDVDQVPWSWPPHQFARYVLDALRTHDPAAHAALVAEQARLAGMRCLTAEQAQDALDSEDLCRFEDDTRAALRGEQPGEVPHGR